MCFVMTINRPITPYPEMPFKYGSFGPVVYVGSAIIDWGG